MNVPHLPHRHLPPEAPAAAAGGQPLNWNTVIIALRCWWKIAMPLSLLLGLLAGAAVYFLVKPNYTASAWLIIKASPEMLLGATAHEDPRKFISNQMELMKSPPIVEPVASKPEIISTPEIAREPEPVQALKRLVKMRPLGQSDFFVIEFTSVVPEKAALVANEMANSYLAYQARDATYRSSVIIKLLEDQLAAQQAKVEDLRNRWQQLAKTTTGIDPFAVKTTTTPAVQLNSPHGELQAQSVKLQLENTTLRVNIQFLETAEAQETKVETTPWELDRLVENHPDVVLLQSRLNELGPLITAHHERSANPAANRTLLQLEREVKEKEAKLARLKEDLRPKIQEDRERAGKAQQMAELARMKQQLAANELMSKVVEEKVKAQIGVQKEFREKTFDEEVLRTEYESAYKLFEAIKSKIDMMRLEQRAPERVVRYQEAKVPPLPDQAAPYKKMAMASLAAMLLPFGMALGVELLHRRVSSRDQLENGGGISVVGEVAALPRTVRGLLTADKDHRDLQLFEESIDGLRTFLSLEHSLEDKRVLAVASAVSGEGKTSLAAQLAVSIAGATGEKTLLIDGDMRSPDIHRIFDVDRGPGLAEVLAGKCPIQDAIDDSFSEKLHLLTAGDLDRNPHRLMNNGEFRRLLEELRKVYRHIVIDTPPILPASEALVMARLADAAVLCARRDFSRVAQIQSAHARLSATGVKVAGVVLNGIPTRSYAYHYGSYYYAKNRYGSSGATSDGSLAQESTL